MPLNADTITLRPDTLAADSLATDSVTRDSLLHEAIVIAPTEQLHPAESSADNGVQTGSWLLLALLVLLVAIGFKFRNSGNYLGMLAKELTTTRRRHNLFDDTVRETSFLLLLNVVSLLSGGLLLYMYLNSGSPSLAGAAICLGIALVYGLFMWLAYRLTGWTFADTGLMTVWLRGHSAAQGLLSLALLPLALASVAMPAIAQELAWAGAAVFIVAKLVFIYKGARIFIHNLSTLIVFFYYLCSLEIVPLILACSAAVTLCPMYGG